MLTRSCLPSTPIMAQVQAPTWATVAASKVPPSSCLGQILSSPLGPSRASYPPQGTSPDGRVLPSGSSTPHGSQLLTGPQSSLLSLTSRSQSPSLLDKSMRGETLLSTHPAWSYARGYPWAWAGYTAGSTAPKAQPPLPGMALWGWDLQWVSWGNRKTVRGL